MRFTKWFRNPAWLALALALALTAPVLWPGRYIFWGTPYFQFIPWRWLAWRLLVQGRFPWWNPFTGLGMPLAANYQTAVLYPGTWLTWLFAWVAGLSGLAYAHGWWVVLHLLLGAWGMARWMQEEGRSRPAAWLAGLAFGFSGYAVARGGVFLSMNAAMAWTPWVLWAWTRLLRRPGRGPLLTLALVMAMQLLTGHAQTTWYTWLFAAALGLRQRPGGRAFAYALLAGVWALLLAGGQMAATAEYTLLSARSQGLEADFALQYSFWPWYYLLLLSPWAFGHPAWGNHWGFPALWEHTIYVGVLPLLLALYALVRAPRRMLFWLGLLAVAQVLALGRFTPVYPWLFRHVPTFDAFQAPARWHLWTVLLLAVLAAHGADAVQTFTPRMRYWLNLGTAGTLALVPFALMGQALLPQAYRTLAWGLLGFAVTAGLGLAVWRFALRRGRRVWLRAILLLTVLDLAVNQQGWYPATSGAAYAQDFPNKARLAQILAGGRFWMPPDLQQQLLYEVYLRFRDFRPQAPLWQARTQMLPNVNLLDGFPGVNAYDPLRPARLARLEDALTTWPEPQRTRLLRLLGVSLRIETPTHSEPLVPAAWLTWVEQVEWVTSEDQVWQALARRLQSPAWAQGVVLEAASPRPLQRGPSPPAAGGAGVMLEGRMYLDGRWDIQVTAPRPGYLVVRQAYYPGWRAWVDGEEVPLYPADGVLMALPVPAGRHRVQVVYAPRHLYAALALQAAAWAAWFVAARRHGHTGVKGQRG